jgi:hypothetical protein
MKLRLPNTHWFYCFNGLTGAITVEEYNISSNDIVSLTEKPLENVSLLVTTLRIFRQQIRT